MQGMLQMFVSEKSKARAVRVPILPTLQDPIFLQSHLTVIETLLVEKSVDVNLMEARISVVKTTSKHPPLYSMASNSIRAHSCKTLEIWILTI